MVDLQQFEFNRPSNAHRAQDAVKSYRFQADHRHVLMGVVSDGCSNVTDDDISGHDKTFTEHGAQWMTVEFCGQAERLYTMGLRGKELMRAVLLGLAESMATYEPGRVESGFTIWNDCKISDELTATLYGYIADSETTVIAVAGDGEVVCNGHAYSVLQKDRRGETGDNYPVNLLYYPRQMWEEQLEHLYAIACFETAMVGRLVLASDGLCRHMTQLLLCDGTEPAFLPRMIIEAHRNERREGFGTEDLKYCSPKEDDASYVGFMNSSLRDSRSEIPAVVFACRQASRERGVYDFIPAWREPSTKEDPFSIDDLQIELGGRTVAWSDYGPEGKFGDRTVFASDSLWMFKTAPCDGDEMVKGFLRPSLASVAISRLGNLINSPLWQELAPLCGNAKPARMLLPSGRSRPFGMVFPNGAGTVSLLEFCDYLKSRNNQWGLKACLAVLLKLHRIVCEMHSKMIAIGNLRPEDVVLTIKRISRPITADGRQLAPLGKKFALDVSVYLANPEVWAVHQPDAGVARGYWSIDEANVHPQLLEDLHAGEPEAMMLQDWFSYGRVACQVLTKCDPFLEGVVRDNPAKSEDRTFRILERILMWSDRVDAEEFFSTAMFRLSERMQEELERKITLQAEAPFERELLIDLYNSLVRCPGCFLQQHAAHKRCQNPACRRRLKAKSIRKRMPLLVWPEA
jgi:hypothetical protein